MTVASLETPRRDVRDYLAILWRWKSVFLLIVVLLPLGTYLLVSRERKVYQGVALLDVKTGSVSPAGQTQLAPAPDSILSLNAEASRITAPFISNIARRFLHPAYSAGDHVDAAADPNTGFIRVTGQASSAPRAAMVANAFVRAEVTGRARAAQQGLGGAIARIEAQLRAMRANDPARAQLSSSLAQLKAVQITQGSDATVIELAGIAKSPVAPTVARSVVLAAILGLLLGVGAVLGAESLDRRIRRPDELEAITGIPLLSLLPISAFNPDAISQSAIEAIDALRGSLMYYNVDTTIDVIMISSPGQGDGKTTVATELARSFARAGRNVILVDCDLRQPRAASRLNVPDAGRLGLGAVLAGVTDLHDALVSIEMEGSLEHGQLRLLPAGTLPPNPAALIGSARMRTLLDQLRGESDLVILDTNPVLCVTDSLPLFELTSGAIIVARLDATSRDALRSLVQVIANARGSVLGVVGTGAAVDGLYGAYSYGNGYASGGNGRGRGPTRFSKKA